MSSLSLINRLDNYKGIQLSIYSKKWMIKP